MFRDELDHVQQVFAGKPLFEGILANELEALERRRDRQTFGRPESQHLSHPSGNIPQSGALPRRGPTLSSYELPPKIQRPLSVHKWLQRDANPVRPPVEDPAGLVSTPRQPLQTRSKRHTGGKKERTSSISKSGTDPIVDAGYESSDSNHEGRLAPRRSGSGGAGHMFGGRARRKDSSTKGSSMKEQGSSNFIEDIVNHRRDEDDLSEIQEIARNAASPPVRTVNLTVHDDVMNVQIERAAARRAIQKARLTKIGVKPPGERVDGGAQTEDSQFSGFSKSVPGAIMIPMPSVQAAKIHVVVPEANQPKMLNVPKVHHPSNKTPPTSLLLHPATPYQYTVPVASVLRPPTSTTVWQQLMNDEDSPKKDGKQGPNKVLQQWWGGSNPTSTPAQDVPLRQPESNGSRTLIAHNDVAATTNLFSTKKSLLDQLDQMQLANEEMLVRNKLLNTTTANLARDVPVAEKIMEEQQTLQALHHVASVHKLPPQGIISAPLGGYGSILDGPANNNGGLDIPMMSMPQQRWQVAHQRNVDVGQLASQWEPIRKWSTELPPPPSYDRLSTIRPSSHKSSLKLLNDGEYNAKRKWTNVSFSVPTNTPPPGTLESFSESARSFLQI